MKPYTPQPSPYRFALLLLPLLALALAQWLWGLLAARTAQVDLDLGVFLLGLALFLSLVLLGLLLYIAYCAFTVRYLLDTESLTISTGGTTHVVPLGAITGVLPPGEAVDFKSVVVRWRRAAGMVPGYIGGSGRSDQLGRVISVATVPAHGQVFVRTQGVTFGVSPRNPAEFVTALEGARKRFGTGGAEGKAARTILSGPSAWGVGVWGDTRVRTLFLMGLVLNALLFGYLSLVYGDLPTRLPLHWNSLGQVDRVGDPIEIIRLPAIALALWLVNALAGWWALGRERAAAIFLLAGGAAVQVVFLAGALSIVLRS